MGSRTIIDGKENLYLFDSRHIYVMSYQFENLYYVNTDFWDPYSKQTYINKDGVLFMMDDKEKKMYTFDPNKEIESRYDENHLKCILTLDKD